MKEIVINNTLEELERMKDPCMIYVTDAMRDTLRMILEDILEGGQYEFRIWPSSTGGIEIVWLSEDYISLFIDDDGEWLICGEDSEGKEYLDEESSLCHRELSTEAVVILKERLQQVVNTHESQHGGRRL